MDEMPNSAHITPRSLSLDAHRGFLMILMAVDHASYFIARVHSLEIWGSALPAYPDAIWFFTRWATHLCAPGFFFLMGIGMTFLADARRAAGWNEDRITRFFIIRGLLLLLFQLVIENPAWMMGYLSSSPGATITRGGPLPGGGTEGIIYLGVLFSLGGSMVFWAFVRKVWSWLAAAISIAAIFGTQYITPGPDSTQTIFSPIITALFIPGHSNTIVVLYPLAPWLGVTGLGLLYGRLFQQFGNRVLRYTLWAGIGLLVIFVTIRVTGEFGNLNIIPAGWMGFLNVVKYPPSLAFLTVTLGINFILMASWSSMEPYLGDPYNPLVIFGRTALFFYLVHLWLYGLFGFFFKSGSGLATMYAVWLLGLGILYGLCCTYDHFKRRKPGASIWRFL
ncbi:MAG: heparan-alpha-glucosaminide N-acetyltransferase domain-containing protein [Syntrophorhabdaceae bacterium]